MSNTVMSNIDVSELAKDELPTGSFPTSLRADFRLFMSPEAHKGMWAHGEKDLSVEICGVLVGRWEQDDEGPYAIVTDFIQCDNASSKMAEVTFTHESWAQINHEMDTKHADARIVGWYHTHPDFGIFLSDRDCFIHEHFFSNPGQVAYVIDPVRELEGVFAWCKGKPAPLPHYWVGESIRTSDAMGKSSRDQAGRADEGAAAGGTSSDAAPKQSPYEFATMLLSCLALFLMGYLLASQQSRWERRTLVEGAVAHFGINKLMKVGLEETLAEVRKGLAEVTEAVDNLPDPTGKLTEDQVQDAAKQRKMIAGNLRVWEQVLKAIEVQYGLSKEERETYLSLLQRKQLELRKRAEAKAAAEKRPPKDDKKKESVDTESKTKKTETKPDNTPVD